MECTTSRTVSGIKGINASSLSPTYRAGFPDEPRRLPGGACRDLMLTCDQIRVYLAITYSLCRASYGRSGNSEFAVVIDGDTNPRASLPPAAFRDFCNQYIADFIGDAHNHDWVRRWLAGDHTGKSLDVLAAELYEVSEPATKVIEGMKNETVNRDLRVRYGVILCNLRAFVDAHLRTDWPNDDDLPAAMLHDDQWPRYVAFVNDEFLHREDTTELSEMLTARTLSEAAHLVVSEMFPTTSEVS